jgi:hypothetical protein
MFQTGSSLTSMTAAGMPEVQAEAVLEAITAAVCERTRPAAPVPDGFAVRIAAAEARSKFYTWLGVVVVAGGAMFNMVLAWHA